MPEDVLSIAGYIEKNGFLTYSNAGSSMMPLLKQGRDLLTVRAKKPGERFAPGDVLLYRRPPGKNVLHRVVAISGDGSYVLLGDNCVSREYGVTDRDVIGVMTGFVRRGKEHSVTEPGYLRYTARILKNEKRRVRLLKLRASARRFARRVLHAVRKKAADSGRER